MITINLHCKIPLSVVHFQTLLVLLDRCLLQHLQKYPSALLRLKLVNLWTLNSLLTLKPSLSHEPLYYLEVHHHAFTMLKAQRSCSKDCCWTRSPQYHLGSNYCGLKLTSRKTKWRGRQIASTLAKNPLMTELASMAFPAVLCAGYWTVMSHRERTSQQALYLCGGIADAGKGLTSAWRLLHTRCTHRAFLHCGSARAGQGASLGGRLSGTRDTWRVFLQCGSCGVE